MSRNHDIKHTSERRGLPRGIMWIAVIALFAMIVPNQAAADTDTGALVRSLLLPGLGQAHQGHYTRAAVYSGVAVFSGFGILLTQVHYNESVDKYEALRDVYTGYQDQLNNGQIISIDDINSTYSQMNAEYNSAEDRLKWRNTMITVFVATYVVNLVDILISKPYEIEENEQLGLMVAPDKIMVTKTIRF